MRRWWNDDPAETRYPEGTLDKWRARIRGEDPTRMYLVQLDERPIGVIQSYLVQDDPDYGEEVGDLGERALSIDLFIGDPSLIGKGHGPALIRAYEKAGFRYLRPYREPDTTDPEHVLLDLHRRDLR